MRAPTFLLMLCASAACLAQDMRQPVSLHLSVRPRYEFVDQGGLAENAHALTARTLMAAHMERGDALKGRVEIINVTHVVDHFNDARNQQLRYPLVRDPEHTDFNQVYLEHASPDTILRAGRQTPRINRTRFIGTGDFRQLIQTFSGVSVETRDVRPLELYYARYQRVATTAGLDRELRLDIARTGYSWTQGNGVLASGYWHDQPVNGAQTGFADSSYRTVALRRDGLRDAFSGARLNHTVEYARQREYAGGDARIDADYLLIGGGLLWPDLFLRVDHERLGSRDGQYGFQTPIGNNHLWQGWADLFTTTPPEVCVTGGYAGREPASDELGGRAPSLQGGLR